MGRGGGSPETKLGRPLGVEPGERRPPEPSRTALPLGLKRIHFPFCRPCCHSHWKMMSPLLSTPTQMWPLLVSTLRAGAEEPMQRCPPPPWRLQSFRPPHSVSFPAPVVVMIRPALAVERLVGSHSLHLWHSPSAHGRRHWFGRGRAGLVLGRGCFLIRGL